MRRLLAITLLLASLSIASGASMVLCARDCAAVEHRHHAPMAMETQHHHHHHLQAVPVASAAATRAGAPHCVRSAPPPLAQRSLPEAPALNIARVGAVPRPLRTGNSPAARIAASPPGPPLVPTQLRI